MVFLKIKALSPDYCNSFVCKCGGCRHTCCQGWGITVSQDEYFRLIGFDCEERFRRKLDCAFKLADNPEPCRYASLAPDYTGKCRIIDGEGYCGLQRQYGEEVLPLVCRMYPRSLKKSAYGGAMSELCVSGSCEKTLELLIADKSALTFSEGEFELPFDGIESNVPADPACFDERMRYIGIINDRSYGLGERIKRLGEAISSGGSFERDEQLMLETLRELILSFEKSNPSMYEYGDRALEAYGIGKGEITSEKLCRAGQIYAELKDKLYRRLPDIDIYIEKMLVNHMFYIQFPYVMPHESIVKRQMTNKDNERSEADISTDMKTDAYASFVTACAIFKLVVIGNMKENCTIDEVADISSEVFRFLEHSGFYSLRKPKKFAFCNEAYAKYEYILR